MNLSAIKTVTNNRVKVDGISDFSNIEIDKIYPNPDQPRKSFEDIEELSNSIKENGLIQPIVIVKKEDKYMIISGERRFRACKMLNHKVIKSHILKADDKKIMELSLVENIQRDDLTDFEKAKFINQLWLTGKYEKKQDLAKALGKSQSYISKAFKSVRMSNKVIKHIEEHKIDLGLEIMQELSSVKDENKQLEFVLNGAKREEIREYNSSLKSTKKKKQKIVFDRVGIDEVSNIHLLDIINKNKIYKITIEEI